MILIVTFVIVVSSKQKSFEEKREMLLNQLYINIEEAKLDGKYECCIEPPCTMCYLGNWIWEDGTCDCDKMMKEDKFDNVCPQCIRGLEEGRCKSTDEDFCKI